MRLLLRTDGDRQTGGGHVMRCLTLAGAARTAGHEVRFVMADAEGAVTAPVENAGIPLTRLPPAPVPPCQPQDPPHAHWLSLPWARDAELTIRAAQEFAPDWLVLDHYGLDARWVRDLRAALPDLRILAIDDLDDRDLGADLLLDLTRISNAPYRHPPMAALKGPAYALLRPEFAAHRTEALARRGGPIRHVLVAPGMMDAAGLAPMALRLLANRFPTLTAEVVMGAQSQSRAEVEALVAAHPSFTLTLDANDMAARLTQADLCIGAGGMTSWERCCLGLPTLTVAVAENQIGGVQQLANKGAIITLTLDEARDPARFGRAVQDTIAHAHDLSLSARSVCTGDGAAKVVAALSGTFRLLVESDARLVFDWRNPPHIRAASLNKDPLDWESHQNWVALTAARRDGEWLIYSEAGRPLGFAGATIRESGTAHWSFYIGAQDAPQGAGGRMMAAFLRRLATRPDVHKITAEVLEDNPASIRLHQRLGFTQVPHDGLSGVLAFAVDAWDVRARLALPAPEERTV